MQRRAEALGRHHPDVDLQPARQHDARARVALREHLAHLGVLHEPLHDGHAGCRGDENVDVADRLLHPAVAAGDHDLPRAFGALQVRRERLRVLRGDGELEALRLAEPRLDRVDDVRLGLRAEARQVADFSLARRLEELGQRVDVEGLVQRLHPLRPEAGDLQELGDRGRELLLQLLEQGAGPGPDDLVDLRVEVRADPRQLREVLARRDRRREVQAQIADGARRVAVGTDAERVRLADLEQIGDVLEDAGDVGVVDRHEHKVTRPLPAPVDGGQSPGWRHSGGRRDDAQPAVPSASRTASSTVSSHTNFSARARSRARPPGPCGCARAASPW